jgi:hypothetical protein
MKNILLALLCKGDIIEFVYGHENIELSTIEPVTVDIPLVKHPFHGGNCVKFKESFDFCEYDRLHEFYGKLYYSNICASDKFLLKYLTPILNYHGRIEINIT